MEAKFNGNKIFYDEKVTDEGVEAINAVLTSYGNHLNDVNDSDKFFNDIPFPYSKLVPDPRFDVIAEDALDEIEQAYKNCNGKITEVTDAIRDYSTGDTVNPSSISTLNNWLNSRRKHNEDEGGGGNPSGDKDLTNNQPNSGENSDNGNNNSDVPNLDGDEDLVIPGGNNSLNGSENLGSDFSGVGTGDELDDNSNIFASDDTSLNNFGTSLLGGAKGKFLVPGPSSTVGSTDGIKSSSAFGAAAAAIVATAVGGKVYHDKKHEDDEDIVEESANDSEKTLEHDDNVETGVSLDNNKDNDDIVKEAESKDIADDLISNSVKFKEFLFNDGEVNE